MHINIQKKQPIAIHIAILLYFCLLKKVNMHQTTIYDIANELHLSASTVSRALKDNKIINEDTRRKVQEYAEKVGYRSNIFASNLRKGASRTIGVVVPRLDSLFVAAILAGAEKIAAQKGYQLLISQSFEQVDKERANVNMMFDKRVDALLVATVQNVEPVNHFKPFIDARIPVVFLDRVIEGLGCPGFIINNTEAAQNATQHLIGQQCQHLWHIAWGKGVTIFSQRAQGFANTCKLNNIRYSIKTFNNLNFDAGAEVARLYNESPDKPDGIFFSNDISAVACIATLNGMGYRVPQHVAIVGFNNDQYSKLSYPPLTTIDYPAYDLGTTAANYLVEHLNGNSLLNTMQNVVLKSELVIRASSVRKQ
jgi:LacI family transcriptional regulator